MLWAVLGLLVNSSPWHWPVTFRLMLDGAGEDDGELREVDVEFLGEAAWVRVRTLAIPSH